MDVPETPRGGIWSADPFRRDRAEGLLGLRRIAARAASAGLAGRIARLSLPTTEGQGKGRSRTDDRRP